MTPEQRLERLERITILFVKAGLRARREGREQDKKIDHLISLQIQNEERFAKVAKFQANTDRRLDSLIDKVGEGRNGSPQPK